MPKNKKLPLDVINHWPEVFNEIEIDVIPINYLDSVRVQFRDGKVWDIDVKKTISKEEVDIEVAMQELFDTYSDAIVNVDFRLDTEKVKSDIQNRTRIFMKKRK